MVLHMPCHYVDETRCIYDVGDETIEKRTSNTKCVAIVRGLSGVQISFEVFSGNYERMEFK